MAETSESGGVRELRFAVVLYGGVSLAIYMHGTTKELHRLVKASALEDKEGETPSERVYGDLLRTLRDSDPHGVRTRVVVDIVGGTSAGGINGIYLAKALVKNQSQDKLRDVWLERGDIRQLLRGWRRIPWQARAAGLLTRAGAKPPLDGDAMSRWLFGALEDMDSAPASRDGLPTLMPDDHQLELFVTTTDFRGYGRELVIGDPAFVRERAHRHVLTFRHGDGKDDFGREDNGWLAFAARATSSFPGAFPPVRPSEFGAAVKASMRKPERFFRLYELADAPAEVRYFVDGGVLNNRPFDHVVSAIRARPAATQVDRRLLYLEPDPTALEEPDAAGAPKPIATVAGALSEVPRQQPILDEILSITRHNDRVRQVRDIIEMAFGDVEEHVRRVVDVEHLVEPPQPETLRAWSNALHASAKEAVGAAYPTYLRSKVSAVVDRYARTICRVSDYPDDCNQAAFVRAALRAWARERLFTETDGRLAVSDRHVEFLRTFDLDYGARRLRFVIAALSWWYAPEKDVPVPPREALDRGKARLYEKLGVLEGAMSGRTLAVDLTDLMREQFSRKNIDDGRTAPDAYVRDRAAELLELEEKLGKALDQQLEGFDAEVFTTLATLAKEWDGPVRKALLVRYLGFPLWDAILFPVQSVGDVGERDAIEVTRFSPEEASLRGPLSGASLGHFGAFFDRDGRERDYLWGRLHGAERLIGMLLPGKKLEQERAAWRRRAFAAIVDEEESVLTRAGPVLAQARRSSS